MAKIPALDRPGTLLPWWMTAIVTGQTTNARLPLSHLGGLPRGAIAMSLANYLANTADTTDADPGAGNLRWNHATQSSASEVYLSDVDGDAADHGAAWPALAAGGHLYFYNPADLDVWQWWSITSVNDSADYVKFGVSLTGSSGSFAHDDPVVVTIQHANPLASDALDVGYNNSGSGLSATDVQGAIDEVAAGVGGGGSAGCIWRANSSNSSSRMAILSNLGLTILDTVAGISGHNKATIAKNSGKKYFEVTVDAMGASGTPTIGVVQMAASGQVGDTGAVSTSRNASWGLLANSGDKYNGSTGSYGSALSANDVVMVAVDFSSGKIWWGKNGTWFAGGDPAAGTGEAFSNLADWLFPAVSCGSGSKVTANFGASSFAHTPPAGFSAWEA